MANHLTGVHVGERAFRAIGGVMNEISCEQIAPAQRRKQRPEKDRSSTHEERKNHDREQVNE